MPKKESELSFEQALERLEAVIESMESGNIPLSDLIDQFVEGSLLLRQCQSKLNAAELRIEKLNLKTGATEVTSIETDEGV